MRLFTALELPGEIVDALVALQPPAAAGIKPVDRERLHLTLHFIGDADLGAIAPALSRVRAARFELTLGALGMFARRGRPAALWAGVERSDALQALHDSIGAALAAAGRTLDSRPYTPHVTLARLKPHADRGTVRAFLARAAIEPLRFEADGFALFSSEAGAGGHVYTVLARFPLG